MTVKKFLVLVCLVSCLAPGYGAQASDLRYGLLLGTFSGKIRGKEALRALRSDKKLTDFTLLLARQKGVYNKSPAYVLVAGPFSFMAQAQRLGKKLERSNRLARTIEWPDDGAVVAVLGKEDAANQFFRLPVAPPEPGRDKSTDTTRKSLAAVEMNGGSTFNSDMYYDGDLKELGNASSVEGKSGKISNALYSEFNTDETLNVAVKGKALAETPVGRSKIRGVVDYNVGEEGPEKVAFSHVWQPSKAIETEVGVASELGGNPERNVFGSVSRKVAEGLRLTQRMDVYEQGEIKTYSGIGITF